MVYFIKMNELKLTQVELFLLLHLKRVIVNVSELLCVALYPNNKRFYTILTFHFKLQILY